MLERPRKNFLLLARGAAQATRMEPLSSDEIRLALQASLAEDIGPGDVTTLATVPANAQATATVKFAVTSQPDLHAVTA